MAKRKRHTLTPAEKALLRAVGTRIRQIREQRGFSVYDLTGDDMPVKDRQHWQRIEGGKKNINLTTVFRVAKALGVEADELLREIGK